MAKEGWGNAQLAETIEYFWVVGIGQPRHWGPWRDYQSTERHWLEVRLCQPFFGNNLACKLVGPNAPTGPLQVHSGENMRATKKNKMAVSQLIPNNL